MDVSFSKPWEMVKNREARYAAVHGVAKSQTQLSNRTTTTKGCLLILLVNCLLLIICSFLTLKIYKRKFQDYFLNKNNFLLLFGAWLFSRFPSSESSQRSSSQCYFLALPTWSLFKIRPKLAGIWGPGLMGHLVEYLYWRNFA